jgi:hypothetical protein
LSLFCPLKSERKPFSREYLTVHLNVNPITNNVTRIIDLLELGSFTTDLIVIDLKSLQVNLCICLDRWGLSSFKSYGKL